jgi:hypothetical protein
MKLACLALFLCACGPAFTTPSEPGEASDLATSDAATSGVSSDGGTESSTAPTATDASPRGLDASSPTSDGAADAPGTVDACPEAGCTCVVVTPGYGCPGAGFVFPQYCAAHNEHQCCNWPDPTCAP